MAKKKVLIFIVAYNAEKFIENVLSRIPEQVWTNDQFDAECLLIDDQSTDQGFFRAVEYTQRHPELKVTILYNPKNQGYGGNQKLGYHYAIRHQFDLVVLLHGDGQYAPELLPDMIAPIVNGEADVVLGSRMIDKAAALKGKMPLYKWVGNQVLTFTQNRLLGSHLSEFHTGYRAYSVAALRSVPFSLNSDYFDFDTDILIQMLDTRQRIKEISIPTFYGDEISRVNGMWYGLLILRTSFFSRLVPRGIYYNPKFDYLKENEQYQLKVGYASSHQFALDRIQPGATVLDLERGPGLLTERIAQKGARIIVIDRAITPSIRQCAAGFIEADIETFDFNADGSKPDVILLLDIVEHLKSPEGLLARLRERYAPANPTVIITTGNIAFIILRLSLLIGQFNYGKRGILDLDHTRLFTFYSLRQMLMGLGYDIVEVKGIPAPYPLALGDNWLSRFLLRINSLLIVLSKGIFAYQIAMVAHPRPTLSHLLASAVTTSEVMRTKNVW